MRAIDEYVERVLDRIPRCLPGRGRIEADLRSHLADRIEAGDTTEQAIAGMGPAEEVARELLTSRELVPASILRRTGAFLIDLGLGLAIAVPVILIFTFLSHVPGSEAFGLAVVLFGVVALTVFLLSLVYFPVTEALFGQTLGKHLLGICVTKENGERIGWIAAIVRRIPFYAEFFLLDAIVAIFTRRNQRAFDLVAQTIVIDVRARGG